MLRIPQSLATASFVAYYEKRCYSAGEEVACTVVTKTELKRLRCEPVLVSSTYETFPLAVSARQRVVSRRPSMTSESHMFNEVHNLSAFRT